MSEAEQQPPLAELFRLPESAVRLRPLGINIAAKTVYDWPRQGLRTWRCGGLLFTTEAALLEFFELRDRRIRERRGRRSRAQQSSDKCRRRAEETEGRAKRPGVRLHSRAPGDDEEGSRDES